LHLGKKIAVRTQVAAAGSCMCFVDIIVMAGLRLGLLDEACAALLLDNAPSGGALRRGKAGRQVGL